MPEQDGGPDAAHRVHDGVDGAPVEALGTLSKARDRPTQGRRHLHGAGMKEERRTQGRPHHEVTPSDPD